MTQLLGGDSEQLFLYTQDDDVISQGLSYAQTPKIQISSQWDCT